MLLQILIHRHGFDHHLVVQLRCVEQMQTILTPEGKTQVGDVESGLVAGDSDDVAILDDRAQQFVIAHSLLGDKAILGSRHLALHLGDIADKLRMFAERLIALRMGAHIAYTDILHGCERWIGRLNLGDHTGKGIVGDPLGEIVQARWVAIDDATTIAQVGKHMLVGKPRVLAVLGAECECSHGFYQCGTVKLTGVYHQSLVLVALECAGHVRYADELLSEVQWQTGGGRQVFGLGQQSADGDAVSGLCPDIIAKTCRTGADTHGYTYYNIYDTFHHALFLRYFFFNTKL